MMNASLRSNLTSTSAFLLRRNRERLSRCILGRLPQLRSALARKLPKYLAPVTLDAPRTARSPHPATGGGASKSADPRSRLLLRRFPGAEKHNDGAARQAGDRVHRTIGLRQIYAPPGPQPDLRALSGTAGDRRGDRRRRKHPDAWIGSEPFARQDRYGVSEADTLSDVDLRQCRFWHPTVRNAAEPRARRSGRIGAAARGA